MNGKLSWLRDCTGACRQPRIHVRARGESQGGHRRLRRDTRADDVSVGPGGPVDLVGAWVLAVIVRITFTRILSLAGATRTKRWCDVKVVLTAVAGECRSATAPQAVFTYLRGATCTWFTATRYIPLQPST
eukprot:scaffold115_cov304-Prasinococcus_capsulatus_cf.AAC.28